MVMPSLSGHFYPRSPCGERRAGCGHVAGGHQISIHALLAESDGRLVHQLVCIGISIHALLAESDPRGGGFSLLNPQFLSTLSLRRATINCIRLIIHIGGFLSTLSLRRATLLSIRNTHNFGISIHALLAESDSKSAQNSGALLRI